MDCTESKSKKKGNQQLISSNSKLSSSRKDSDTFLWSRSELNIVWNAAEETGDMTGVIKPDINNASEQLYIN